MVAAAITMNGDAIPNGPTRMAEITGPSANPNTSAEKSRPRFRPRLAPDPTTTNRLIAGPAAPIANPEITRPAMMTVAVVPKPIINKPAALRSEPPKTMKRA